MKDFTDAPLAIVKQTSKENKDQKAGSSEINMNNTRNNVNNHTFNDDFNSGELEVEKEPTSLMDPFSQYNTG